MLIHYREAFLMALLKTGSWAQACRAVGKHRTTVWRHRNAVPTFRAETKSALDQHARDLVESVEGIDG